MVLQGSVSDYIGDAQTAVGRAATVPFFNESDWRELLGIANRYANDDSRAAFNSVLSREKNGAGHNDMVLLVRGFAGDNAIIGRSEYEKLKALMKKAAESPSAAIPTKRYDDLKYAFDAGVIDDWQSIATREQKKAAIESITAKLGERLSIQPSDVFIVIHEPPLENWGLGGTQKE